MGIIKMKLLARSYIWWPCIDKAIENVTKECVLCLEYANNPPRASLHVWDWPEKPNVRLHADFCGPIDKTMYLIITDAHSKWVDIKEMARIDSEATIDALREYICTWGIPIRIVTDNGPAFIAESFKEFLQKNGIKHTLTPPYHPASNGAAENSVKSFKNKFKLLRKEGLSKKHALAKYLFHYRSSPHCTTGVSPAKLQLGYKFRTRWDLLKTKIKDKVLDKQTEQKTYMKGNRKASFDKLSVVMAKDYRNNKWKQAKVIEKLSPVTYSVKTAGDHLLWKRHIDQLRPCNIPLNECVSNTNNEKGVIVNRLKGIEYNFDNFDTETKNNITTKDIKLEDIVKREEIANKKDTAINIENQKEIIVKPQEIIEVRRSKRIPKPKKMYSGNLSTNLMYTSTGHPAYLIFE